MTHDEPDMRLAGPGWCVDSRTLVFVYMIHATLVFVYTCKHVCVRMHAHALVRVLHPPCHAVFGNNDVQALS